MEFSEFYISNYLDTLALLNAKEGKKTKESERKFARQVWARLREHAFQ